MLDNRRRSLRILRNLPARWRRGRHELEVRVLDVSAQGLLIGTAEHIPLNHVIDLLVTLPDGVVSLLLTSRFVGSTRRGRGIGASILVASPEDARRWGELHRAAIAEVEQRLHLAGSAAALRVRRPS